MEFVLLLAVVLAAAAYVALARDGEEEAGAPPTEELHAARLALLAELRELDEDAAASRISADDRSAGRRALGPRLREVTEALRELGEPAGTRS